MQWLASFGPSGLPRRRDTTGSGNDTIRFAGSGNTINAGAGNNTLENGGSNNTIVLPTAGQGNDNVFDYVMQNNDTLDLRPMLAQAGWNGDASTLDQFLHLGMSGSSAVISVTSGGVSTDVATLQDSGPLSLATLLAHSIT